MVVEVLRPHDCLKDPTRQGLLSPPMKHQQHHSQRNPNPNRVVQPQPDRRKQRKPTRPTTNVVQKAPVLAGQVKILKRGEELPKPAQPQPQPQSAAAAPKEQQRPVPQRVPDLGSTERMGPNPKKVPKQKTRINPALGFYAGSSSCIASPPPSSVPLPSFFAKKTVVSSTDEAASELLKLLRLNLS